MPSDAHTCVVCHQPLGNSWLVDSHYKYSYCVRHSGKLPTCYSCGRIICQNLTGGGILYNDDRKMCNLCRKAAIDTVTQAQPIIVAVRKTLARFTLDLTSKTVPIRLGDQAELKRLVTGGYAENPAGVAVCGVEWQKSAWVRVMKEIVILYGLPSEHFAEILAHEMGHAWIWLNDYPPLPPNVSEGLCELFAYIWLRQRHTPDSEFRQHLMEQNQNKIYGEGFQLAKVKFKKHHLLELLAYIKEHQQFP